VKIISISEPHAILERKHLKYANIGPRLFMCHVQEIVWASNICSVRTVAIFGNFWRFIVECIVPVSLKYQYIGFEDLTAVIMNG
jgi:hypothetical protein